MGNGPSYSLRALPQWYSEGRRYYGAAGYAHAAKNFRADDLSEGCLSGKTVVVTGANQGIGYFAALRCAALGGTVHLLCRNAERGAAAAEDIKRDTGNKNVWSHQLDVSEFGSIRKFCDCFAKEVPEIDVLVNNAGCMPSEKSRTSEGNEVIFATTIGGTLLLTSLLHGCLKKAAAVRGEPARVVNVSSGGAYTVAPRASDFNFDGGNYKYDATLYYAYAKRTQILLTERMANIAKERGDPIVYHSMHPGWADTTAVRTAMPDFHKQQGKTLRSPAEGADTIVFLAGCKRVVEDFDTGLFWFDRQPVRKTMPLSGTHASKSVMDDLWGNACSFVGVTPH